MIIRRDTRRAEQKPPRPPAFRLPSEDDVAWAFGSSRAVGRGQEGDPCGSPELKISSDEEEAGE